MERNDLAFYRGWLRKAPGQPRCVWLYQCLPDEIAENNKFNPFPGFHAHTLSRQFQMFGKDGLRGFQQAQAAAITPEQKQRVAVFAKDEMLAGWQKWEAKQKR